MASAAHRLHLVRYEDEPDWNREIDRDEERVLDDHEVARLLLCRAERAHPRPDPRAATALGVLGDPESVAGMRGLFIGLACAAVAWSLVAAIFLLG